MKKYGFGFEVWGLVLFLVIMLPNLIWFAVPAGGFAVCHMIYAVANFIV